MRRFFGVVIVVGSLVGVGGQVQADRRRNSLPSDVAVRHRTLISGSCEAAAGSLTLALAVDAKTKVVLQHRCDIDLWTAESKACFAKVASPTEAFLCLDTLSKVQRRAVEGDADRLADTRLSRWLMRRTFAVPDSPMLILASYTSSPETIENVGTARTLHSKGLSAYQAGRYDVASKSFSAAITASPTADNVYLAAQAYRMKGERAKALELYERYLEVAPRGPAAPACRYQIERLRDSNP